MSNIEHARQTHLKACSNIPFQTGPTGGVVARPSLRITLDTWGPSSRDRKNNITLPCLQAMLLLRLKGGTCHQQTVQGSTSVHWHGLAHACANCVLCLNGVLVVVVPANINATFKNLRLQLRLPPAHRLRLCEIKVRTLTIPVGLNHRF